MIKTATQTKSWPKYAFPWLLGALFLLYFGALDAQSCAFNGAQGMTISEDSDMFAAGTFMPSTMYDVFPASFAANVTVQGDATVRVCFYGDMEAADETWTTTVAGTVFPNTGGFTPLPTQGNPRCEDFTIPAAAFQSDLTADGKIDISFSNFGAGWQSSTDADPTMDEFNAYVERVNANFIINLTLTASATQACTSGSNITFTANIPPGSNPNDNGQFTITPTGNNAALTTQPVSGNMISAVLSPSMLTGGTYLVSYVYSAFGCDYRVSRNVEITAPPVATLQNVSIDCHIQGATLSLSRLFTPTTTLGGEFQVNGVAADQNYIINQAGIYNVSYTVGENGACGGALTGNATLTVSLEAQPAFQIIGPSSPACSSMTQVFIGLERTSTGENSRFTINGTDAPSTSSIPLPVPMMTGTFSYTICLSERNAGCDEQQTCQTYITRNDGNNCGANAPFMSTCAPPSSSPELCPVDVKNSLRLECSFFQLNVGRIAFANLTPTVTELSCSDPTLSVMWRGETELERLQSQPIGSTNNQSLGQLAGLGVLCSVFNFDLPFIGAPFSPVATLFGCNTSINQVVSTALQLTTQGAPGGLIIADTDSDGAFDYVMKEYEGTLESGTINVPNNVVGSGHISVRHVFGFPDGPKAVCGDPASGGLDLLDDILPIDAIPVAGPIIKNILATANCSIDLAFTDEKTIHVPVYNNDPPAWANCPAGDYYFSATNEDCNAPANWSIPVAYDACTGSVLTYLGRTNGTSTQHFTGTPEPEVVPGQNNLTAGVYQTAGPVLGSDLPVGTYQIEFTAYSCAARSSTCSFNLIVEEGNVQLVCPADVVVRNDDEQCSAVVRGLEPTRGISCAAVINYRIDYPAESGLAPLVVNTPYSPANRGIHNFASGQVFPKGTSTITYQLLLDQNGNGTISGSGESQECSFTVTVQDISRPTPLCADFTVKLDNTGNRTVFAVDQLNGSPFVNAGSYDNCDAELNIQIQRPGEDPTNAINFGCADVGTQILNLIATDDDGNQSTCISYIDVEEFLDGIQIEIDVPELCLEANNPQQFDFSNYLNITLPNGTTVRHEDVANNNFLGEVEGAFGISAFLVDGNSPTNDPGTITADGIYTPGTGIGYVQVSYIMALPEDIIVPQNGPLAFGSCFIIAHTTFELRQPLEMESPECICVAENERVVNLGEVRNGLEPYTIQYDGAVLDVDGNGNIDDIDGEYVYSVANGHDITDYVEDLGELQIIYTQPTWSIAIVDARGCEIFRSGSCDNDDQTIAPSITCPTSVDMETDPGVCTNEYRWAHPRPTDNCDIVIYTYTITNAEGTVAGPFDLIALVNNFYTLPNESQAFGTYDFYKGTSTIAYYAEDAVGNFVECSFTVTVTDPEPPTFINCPEPAVIVDAPALWCSSFANYSLPLATDNCDMPMVTQVDNTGLTSGDLYPVGITINTFEAIDESGNTTRCDVKVIVNDFHTPPTWECPGDVTTTTDPGKCGAIVGNIAPSNLTDNCEDHLTVVYRIDDVTGQELSSGLDDASGNFFDLGTSTVRYSLQDMPLLLITEVTHDLSDPVDGTLPVPGFTVDNPATSDYFEVTNFNSAAMDVSCLQIERIYAGGSEIYNVPTFTILEPGGVLTIHFGDGVDDPANDFFNVPSAANLIANEPAAYILSLSRSILDVAVLNGFDISGLAPPAYNLGDLTIADYWSGTVGPINGSGIVRTTVWDTDTAADFAPGEACLPTTIGQLNPRLPLPTPNGTQTAIQAQPTVRLECSLTVNVTDDESAVCGLYSDYMSYSGEGEAIGYGECIESSITIVDGYSIADLNLFLSGISGNFGDLTITLISPSDTEVELFREICSPNTSFTFTLDGDPEFGEPIVENCLTLGMNETYVPVGNIEAFNGEPVQGEWILQIGHNGPQTIMPVRLDSWSLEISARDHYDQDDEILDNDLDLCGAEFTYFHPILFDNCPGGSVQQTITFEDGTIELNQSLPILAENTEFTYFFQVGETEVLYTLTDAAGNISNCGFTITVLDVQFPEIICPADLVIQLNPGECETIMYPTMPVFEFDNCPEYALSSFPPGTPVPIGDTLITLIITDASGNETTCTYNLTVLEFETDQALACINEQNVSLGADCEATITPDMVLSGDLYRCYDNYVVTLYPDLPDSGVEPISTSPIVTVDYVGETIIAEICDPESGECCWGYINVEYKLIPEFICPTDVTVNCNDATGPGLLGFPEITSCVPGGAAITFDDEVQDNDDCGDPRLIIIRTWTVADAFDNSAQCVQTITVAAFDLMQIDFPENYNGTDNPPLDCADVLNDPDLTSPDNLGFPTIDGEPLYSAGLCSAAMNFTDETFFSCENSFTIFRQWRVINECLPNPLASALTFTQIIRVEDLDGPDLVCPDDAIISVSPFDCTATYQVPPLVAIDACSEVIYQVEVNGDTLVYNPANTYLLSDLAIGEHTITYLASDECGELSSCSYSVTVEDLIEPTASCDDELNVSLGGGDVANGLTGEARILASDVDEGSNDNCSAVSLAVRRNFWNDGDCSDNVNRWSPWGDFIDFYCCDVAKEITIELRVTDATGNENICWLFITPEDKLNPFCLAPDDIALDCNELPLTFPDDIEQAFEDDFQGTSLMMTSLFGGANGTDNCAVDTIVERTPNIQLNECGWGTITRRFEAWQLRPVGDVNENGVIDIDEVFRSNNSCTQEITIHEVHDFEIDFPEDADADCGTPDVPTIVTTATGCDVLVVNTGEPVIFAATGDECYKLSITYDVINWCVWDGEYEGLTLSRMTEDDGETLPVDRAVEGNERPVVRVVSSLGFVDDDCNGINDSNGVQYTVTIDRNHNDRDGDSSLPNTVYDNIPDNSIDCIPHDQFGRRNYGRYIYTQFVKVYDSTVPVIVVGDYGGPTDNCPGLLAGQFGDDDGNCEELVSIPFTVTDECELFDGAGNLVINIVSAELDAFAVDTNNDGDIKANEFVAETDGLGDVLENITDNGDGTYLIEGVFPIITAAMGDNIYHAIRILLEDGCGNQTSQVFVFDVIDCKGPAPICINGLTVTLMPQEPGTDADGDGDEDGCAMAIWAIDFEGSLIDDCTGQGPNVGPNGLPLVTKYAIYRATEVEADPDFVPDPVDTGLVLTQDDDETTVVYIYAFDEDGNYDYCETYVLVQEHMDCGIMNGNLNGVIATENNETIEGVEVSISGDVVANMTTNTDGTYNFEYALGGDYSITPYLNAEPLNGVSTFDIVLMSKHILGTQLLDSPYKLIAADVNNSETITTLDLIRLRKLILNIDTEFVGNTSWRFVSADYDFPIVENPWSGIFPELYNVNDAPITVNADFVGVKVGDVNGSAQANALAGDDRTLNGHFNLSIENVSVKAGNLYTVTVRGTNMENIEGFQGTLNLNAAELVEIKYGVLAAGNFGMRYATEGYITTSWNDNNGISTSQEMHRAGLATGQATRTEVLFSLVIRPTVNAELSDIINVNSRYTFAEAYGNGNTMNVGIEFSRETFATTEFELYQNTPNPFAAETLISFHLQEDAEASLTINDASGRVLTILQDDYTAGYHTVNVTKEMIQGATGVLTYTITAGEFIASKTMIAVK